MLQSRSFLSPMFEVDTMMPVTQKGLCAQALITREYVLVLNAEEEAVVGFIEELQRRLAPKQPTAHMATPAASASLPDLHHVRSRARLHPATTPCILHSHELWHGSLQIVHTGS